MKNEPIMAVKGFNQDMTCQGYQYIEGQTHEFPEAKLCVCGAHACERPLDVFAYYPPATSVYHRVEMEDVSSERSSDGSKICAKRIKIGARLSIAELVKLQTKYVKAHTTTENTDTNVSTAGDRGVSTAGDFGVSTASYGGVSTAGDCGVSTAGDRGVSTAGDYGVSTAGYGGVSTAGDRGVSTAGDRGVSTAGDFGVSTSRSKSATAKNGLSVARGNGVRVKGGMGALLVIAEEECDSYEITAWKAAVVDGENIKPNTWYKLEDGELVEADDPENDQHE